MIYLEICLFPTAKIRIAEQEVSIVFPVNG
jgi:hypothetical protein